MAKQVDWAHGQPGVEDTLLSADAGAKPISAALQKVAMFNAAPPIQRLPLTRKKPRRPISEIPLSATHSSAIISCSPGSGRSSHAVQGTRCPASCGPRLCFGQRFCSRPGIADDSSRNDSLKTLWFKRSIFASSTLRFALSHNEPSQSSRNARTLRKIRLGSGNITPTATLCAWHRAPGAKERPRSCRGFQESPRQPRPGPE